MVIERLHIELRDKKRGYRGALPDIIRTAATPAYHSGLTINNIYEKLGPTGDGVTIDFMPADEEKALQKIKDGKEVKPHELRGQRAITIDELSKYNDDLILTVENVEEEVK